MLRVVSRATRFQGQLAAQAPVWASRHLPACYTAVDRIHTSRRNDALRRSNPVQAPLGPLIRMAMRVGFIVASSVGKAAFEAYQDVQKRSAANPRLQVFRPMNLDEAKHILDMDGKEMTLEQVEAKYSQIHKINGPSEGFAGSPYIQKKVDIARGILVKQIKTGGAEGPDAEQATEEQKEAEAPEEGEAKKSSGARKSK
mmetsp:Transcript_43131/g.91634  ORF Transcript_43131/g.91634 Transcript_43131/m.91634 type:complete len:199 (-) Transcript_43131:140-736(-)|eukprot:CAMPEP_0204333120 /NCGR_PEP_ID=MMETSP0469-20131031/16974_1 /ASSEMBLY_ACC=CAM_ASM_000384 /TAXON_ID=2969 /ORGANISM="Oxyrrhis marina" /LENGTH=198 /DNA_ID=CAMNT_0051316401 /DNA_START=57 /DNA_END=653 /DNA_ORIENTATION=-